MYGDVPPTGESVAAPFDPPLHEMFVCDETGAEMATGCVIFTVCVVTQLPASVIVQVYVPAANPVAVAAVPPDGAQTYVNGLVPPEGVAVAVPLVPPLQLMFVCAVNEEVSSGSTVTLIVRRVPLAAQRLSCA